MSCDEASVQQDPQRPIGGTVLAIFKLFEVPVIFVEGESMSQSEAKSQLRQLLAAQYLGILRNLRRWLVKT